MGEGESTCQRRVSSKGKRSVSVAHSSAAFNLNTLSRNLCTFSSKKQLHEAKKSLLCYVSNMNRSRRASAKQKKAVQQESGCEKDGGKSGRKLALSGKVVYLDIKDSRQAQSIANKLKKLGAVVETFLSKDLNYVISSTPPSRSSSQPKGHCDGLGPESPSFANTPSPYSSVPSPTYTNVGGKIVPVTRGQAMLQIARSRTRSPSPSSVVASAEKLGIKIISIEGAEKWLNKELNKLGHSEADDAAEQQSLSKKKKAGFIKCKKLQHPYLKVEATNHHYRPFYLELPNWPHINVDTPAATCPFDGKGVASVQRSGRGDRDGLASIGHCQTPGSQSASHRRSVEGEDSSRLVGYPILTAGDLRRQRERRKKEQRRRGYCECCAVKYDDIDKHVQEQCHRDFARDKSNYDGLDDLMRACPSTGEFLRSTLLTHCKQRASAKPLTSGQMDDSTSDSSSSSNDQGMTVKPKSPAKPHQLQASDAQPEMPTGFPGYMTPTRTPRHPSRSALSPAAAKRRCHGDEDGELSRHGNQNSTRRTPGVNTDNNAEGNTKDGPERDPDALLAVVIRRPGVKGVYGSPCRKLVHGMSPQHEAERTPKKVRERSLIFGDTSIGSLQPVPEELVSVSMVMVADGRDDVRGNDSAMTIASSDRNFQPQMERGRKKHRELSGSKGHPKSRRALGVASVREPESQGVEEDEVNVLPLTSSPQKVPAEELIKSFPAGKKVCGAVDGKDTSGSSTGVLASKSISSFEPETVKVTNSGVLASKSRSSLEPETVKVTNSGVLASKSISSFEPETVKVTNSGVLASKSISSFEPETVKVTNSGAGTHDAGRRATGSDSRNKTHKRPEDGEPETVKVTNSGAGTHDAGRRATGSDSRNKTHKRPEDGEPETVKVTNSGAGTGRRATGSGSRDKTHKKDVKNPTENSSNDNKVPKPKEEQSKKKVRDSNCSRQEGESERSKSVSKSKKQEDKSKKRKSKQQATPPKTCKPTQQKTPPCRNTPPQVKNYGGAHSKTLCSPPETPRRTPKKQTRVSPKSKLHTTPTRHQQQLQEQEDTGSSPIYARAVIHTSTPIVLTTRKLRHVDEAISQDADAVCQLLDNDNQQSCKKSRRSILADSCQAETSSHSAEKGGKSLTQVLVDEAEECQTPKRRSSRKTRAAEAINLQPETPRKDEGIESSASHNESCIPETKTVEVELLRTPVKLREEETRPSLLMTLVRREHPSPQSATKKVKLTKSWRLLSDNSMSRLLQSEPEGSPFKGFQGNEVLPSDMTFEYASEVEVTDDEDREWLIGEEEKEEESDFGEESLQEFIPHFSSPGKRSDSSWDDACDQYLNLTVQQKLLSEPRRPRTPRKVSASPANKKRKRSRSRGKGRDPDVESNPNKRRRTSVKRKSSAKLAWGVAPQPGLSTPTKRQRGEREQSSRGGKTEEGEEIQRVDEDVVFNYASPRRDKQAFSPLRALNSNLAWCGLAASLSPRTRSRASVPVKLPTPFVLE